METGSQDDRKQTGTYYFVVYLCKVIVSLCHRYFMVAMEQRGQGKGINKTKRSINNLANTDREKEKREIPFSNSSLFLIFPPSLPSSFALRNYVNVGSAKEQFGPRGIKSYFIQDFQKAK